MASKTASSARRDSRHRPATAPVIASSRPKPRKSTCAPLDPAVNAYLDFALPAKGIQRHEFIRKLLSLTAAG